MKAFKSNQIFSYSRLSTFKTCKEQYKLVYLDGIRKPDESIEAFMGKCVHATLEWLYQPENMTLPYITFDSVCIKYDEIWLDSWHKKIHIADAMMVTDHYYSIGKRCLANYFNKYGPTFGEYVVGTEKEVSFSIDNKYYFRGVIDRLDQPEPGHWIIHDYKTGKRAKTPNMAKKDLQLAMYQIAIEQSFSPVKKVTLNWHFLRNGVEMAVTHTREEIESFRRRLIREVNKIIEISGEASNFYPAESILCNWCYLWDECSAKSTQNPSRSAD